VAILIFICARPVSSFPLSPDQSVFRPPPLDLGRHRAILAGHVILPPHAAQQVSSLCLHVWPIANENLMTGCRPQLEPLNSPPVTLTEAASLPAKMHFWLVPCILSSCIIATSAPDQPIAASHFRRSWRLCNYFEQSMHPPAMHLVVRTNVHQHVGTRLHKRKSGWYTKKANKPKVTV